MPGLGPSRALRCGGVLSAGLGTESIACLNSSGGARSRPVELHHADVADVIALAIHGEMPARTAATKLVRRALNGVNPEAYIAATLRKILDNHMQRDIAELMPWNFRE